MQKDKPRSERLGEILGFGASLLIFVSIFYYILSRYQIMPEIFSIYSLPYPLVLTIAVIIYVFSVILRELLKK